MVDGFKLAAERYGISLERVAAAGLGTPGPASARGVLSTSGSTNLVHSDWPGFDIRLALEQRLEIPVVYINDGNAWRLVGTLRIVRRAQRCYLDLSDYRDGLGRGPSGEEL
jgi:predicted NBD/HSP70 family sugar kinase